MPGCAWKHKAAEAPRIIAAKSNLNAPTDFILRDSVQEGSHTDHTEEEVNKGAWERESFCSELYLGEVGSTIKFDTAAQCFRVSEPL